MSNGKIYTGKGLTVASKELPLGIRLLLTNTANLRSVEVTVTDRGPYVAGRGLDVSERVARLLGFHAEGLAKLKVEVVW